MKVKVTLANEYYSVVLHWKSSLVVPSVDHRRRLWTTTQAIRYVSATLVDDRYESIRKILLVMLEGSVEKN
jgi:hypothetical protein